MLYPWVSWKDGRSWVSWHMDDATNTGRTFCGRIPKGAISHAHGLPDIKDVCMHCVEAAAREGVKS